MACDSSVAPTAQFDKMSVHQTAKWYIDHYGTDAAFEVVSKANECCLAGDAGGQAKAMLVLQLVARITQRS